MPISRIDTSGFSPQGKVTTSLIEDGALSANAAGRSKIAAEFFNRDTLDKFASSLFAANKVGRSKFSKGFIDTGLLEDNAISATCEGRAKISTDFFDLETVEDKFEDHSIPPSKLLIESETWDFSTATALKAKNPSESDDVVTLGYFEAHGGGVAGIYSYRIIDTTVDAVPGQPHTYYVDKGNTTYGYNVQPDDQSVPDIRVVLHSRELLWTIESDLGSPTIPGDFTIVRSLSTGQEGPAAVGSTNAVKFDLDIAGPVWIHYRRKSLATA